MNSSLATFILLASACAGCTANHSPEVPCIYGAGSSSPEDALTSFFDAVSSADVGAVCSHIYSPYSESELHDEVTALQDVMPTGGIPADAIGTPEQLGRSYNIHVTVDNPHFHDLWSLYSESDGSYLVVWPHTGHPDIVSTETTASTKKS